MGYRRTVVPPFVDIDANDSRIAERTCIDLSLPPPMIQFFGVVDTKKFVLADNPNIGLDETTRNCSAIFLTWTKFPDLQNAKWYYAGIRMVPKLCVCNAAQNEEALDTKVRGI